MALPAALSEQMTSQVTAAVGAAGLPQDSEWRVGMLFCLSERTVASDFEHLSVRHAPYFARSHSTIDCGFWESHGAPGGCRRHRRPAAAQEPRGLERRGGDQSVVSRRRSRAPASNGPGVVELATTVHIAPLAHDAGRGDLGERLVLGDHEEVAHIADGAVVLRVVDLQRRTPIIQRRVVDRRRRGRNRQDRAGQDFESSGREGAAVGAIVGPRPPV